MEVTVHTPHSAGPYTRPHSNYVMNDPNRSPLDTNQHGSAKFIFPPRVPYGMQNNNPPVHHNHDFSPGMQHMNRQAFQFPEKLEPEPTSPHIQNMGDFRHNMRHASGHEQQSPLIQTNVGFQKMFGAAGTVQEAPQPSPGLQAPPTYNQAMQDPHQSPHVKNVGFFSGGHDSTHHTPQQSPLVKSVGFFGGPQQQQAPPQQDFSSSHQSPMQSPMQSPHVQNVGFNKVFAALQQHQQQQQQQQMQDSTSSPHNSGSFQPGFFAGQNQQQASQQSQHSVINASQHQVFNRHPPTSFSASQQQQQQQTPGYSQPPSGTTADSNSFNAPHDNQVLDMSQLHIGERPFSVGSVSSNIEDLAQELFSDLDGGGANHGSTSNSKSSTPVGGQSSNPPSKPKSKSEGRPREKSGRGKSRGGGRSSGLGRGAVCGMCGKLFNNSSALAKHKLTHSDERKYQCNICSKAFKRQDHLNGHMMTHREKKPFECKFEGCDKSYCDARSLRRHLENHHNAQQAEGGSLAVQFDRPSSGPMSPAQSQPSTPTSPHTWMFSEPKVVSCHVCGKGFKNLPALNGHMRLHGGYTIPKKEDEAGSTGSAGIVDPIATAPPVPVLQPPPMRRQRHAASKGKDAARAFNIPSASSSDTSIQGLQAQSEARGAGDTLRELAALGDQLHQQQQQRERQQQQNLDNTLDELQELLSDATGGLKSDLASMQQSENIQSGGSLGQANNQPATLFSMSSLDTPQTIVDSTASLSDTLQQLLPDTLSPDGPSGISDPDPDGFSGISSILDQVMREPLIGGRDPLIGGVSVLPKPLHPATEDMPRKRHFSADPDRYTSRKMPYRGYNRLMPSFQQPMQPLMLPKQLTMPVASGPPLLKPYDQSSNVLSNRHSQTVPASLSSCGGAGSTNSSANTFLRPQPRTRPDPGQRVRYKTEPMGRTDCTIQPVQPLGPPNGPAVGKGVRRKQRPAPLVIPPSASNYAFQSRLRSPRLSGDFYALNRLSGDRLGNSLPPYTPPPMLSPMRRGTGLFCRLAHYSGSSQILSQTWAGPNTAPSLPSLKGLLQQSTAPDTGEATAAASADMTPPLPSQVPETDIQPHVNIGPDYQAMLPEFVGSRQQAKKVKDKADLMFSPDCLTDFTEMELDVYKDVAVSAAMPGNGVNLEYALHVLSYKKGCIPDALACILDENFKVNVNHPMHGYTYSESDSWTEAEVSSFHQALIKHDKDFFCIGKEVGTKPTGACVEMYYLWKKVCSDEHKRLRIIRRKKEQETLYNLRSRAAPDTSSVGGMAPSSAPPTGLQQALDGGAGTASLDMEPPTLTPANGQHEPMEEASSFTCDYSNCRAVFTSRRAMTVHVRSHTTVLNSTSTVGNPDAGEFPCKNCGRVFLKVKSRSAHMRSCRTPLM